MEEIAKIVTNYGTGIIFCVLFIWDWVANRKETTNALSSIKDAVTSINSFLENEKENNENISKSLDLLQKSMDRHDKKLDTLLEIERERK